KFAFAQAGVLEHIIIIAVRFLQADLAISRGRPLGRWSPFARGGRRLSVERGQQCAGQVTTTAAILHERVRRAVILMTLSAGSGGAAGLSAGTYRRTARHTSFILS